MYLFNTILLTICLCVCADILGGDVRIEEITRRIADLRKVYADCKSSAASIDRKKKKIRKRDSKLHLILIYRIFLLLTYCLLFWPIQNS